MAIQPTERLCIPHRKRLSHTYVTNEDGVRELRIDYGLKEVTFDEERLFAFGEQLVREPSFTGETALTWGPGYTWDEIRPLLEALVAEGIVQRGDVGDFEDSRGGGLVPSKLPPSVCPLPRFWSATECESITRDLTGHAVEIGYLEAAIPVFRVAHPALDSDGRQVGEGNVYPTRLRLDRETEWRVCQYSGSRYRDEMPMNVTALKAMIKYWKPMMTMMVEIRGELQRRLGLALSPWTIGELHLLSAVVLAVPAYQLLTGGGSTPQRPLHPVLSSLFRITDGIRMTTHAMLFSIEHTRRADEPMPATQLYTYVEQNGVFVGETGVCAGPKHLVDEFFATAIDGRPPPGIAGIELPAEVRGALSQLAGALDYGCYGLQAWGVSLSVWLAMSRAVESLLAILEPAEPALGDDGARLCALLRGAWERLEAMQITLGYDRDVHHKAYLDMYERAWRAVRVRVGPPTLAEAIAPVPEAPMHHAAGDRLRGALAPLKLRGDGGASGALDIDRIVEVLIRYLREEQGILAATRQIQDAINVLLDRPRPVRPLTVRDFAVTYTLQSGPGGWPYVFDILEDVLGVRVECTASAIEISGPRDG